jgi:hypothetical protein
MDRNRQTPDDSLRWLVPALALILVFGMAARAPLDSDLWWHLRAGQTSLEQGRPLLVDTFSHTRAGEAWTNHSWLAQVILYLVFRSGGILALAGLVAALAAASLGMAYGQMEGHPLLRAFILVLAAAVAAPLWSPRPQLFSLLLFAALGFLLARYRKYGRGRLWQLVPLFILWSNLHGGYILGLLLIGATGAGMIFDRMFREPDSENVRWSAITRLALWGAAGWFAVTINPNGFAMWAIPLKTVAVGALQALISEWASPDFHDLSQQPFLWLLFLTLICAALSRHRPSGAELFSVVGFAYLGFLARRNFGPFALVAAPALSRQLADLAMPAGERFAGWMQRWQEAYRTDLQPTARFTFTPRVRIAFNIVILVVLSGGVLVKLLWVTSPGFYMTQSRSMFPAAAAEWIEGNAPPGKLFNDYNWGGYLTWTLRDYPVFVDGRTDLYDDEVLNGYLTAVQGKPGWEQVLVDYGVNLALVSPEGGLARELDRNPDWQRAYQDGTAAVYLRRASIPP